MPGTVITGSPNITLFDSRIIADICLGKFFIDASPSVWITDNSQSPVYNGQLNIQGIKIQITNPYGVIIKPYGSSYDIDNPASSPIITTYERAIPTQAGTLQYGVYTIALKLTDESGTTYEVIKTINVCTYNADQNPCDDRLRLVASCKNGTLGVYLSEPPLFKGFYSQSKTQTIVVNYPTTSGHAVTNSTFPNFSVQLFEGVYKVVVNVCALYNLTDNVFLNLPYAVTKEKNVKCLLDYTCIWPKIKQLWDNIKSGCSQKDAEKYSSIALSASLLIQTIELANDAGEDASDYISELETLLGCVCTCDCSGSPIVNGTPSTNIAIEGCGFVKTTVGLTDNYTFNNPEFTLEVDDVTGTLSVGSPQTDECERTQSLLYSANAAYAAMKTRINTTAEYNFWASVINNVLNPLTATCLGYTSGQWAALTLAQKFAAIIAIACAGGTCTSSISAVDTTSSGNDVILTWVQSGGYKVEIYVDGVLLGSVLAAVNTFTVNGGADGNNHTYLLIPICSNGNNGTTATGSYNYLGCPTVTPPVVSSNSVTDAECPYDITSLLSTPPAGITVEWHTANNTLAGTLVPDPTNVSGGIYYAFAKNTDGCYSTATTVTIICESATSCTAPQSLLVTEVSGDFRVTFNSAANPPPGNSYTVKRRLASAPDVDGSYTTIGTPVYNAGLAKWVITDTTGVDNTLYVYKAISNCGGSPATTPFATYTFANITCPSLTLTPGSDYIDYSFTNVGGEVSKYEVKIYDATGLTLIHTDTILPSFSTPITGTFTYLDPETVYQIQVTVYIGTSFTVCPLEPETTTAEPPGANNISWNYENNAGLGGTFRIFVDGVTQVYTSVSSSGAFLAPVGAIIEVIEQSTLTGACEIDISGPYTNSTSVDHINSDDFTVAVGSYVIHGISQPS